MAATSSWPPILLACCALFGGSSAVAAEVTYSKEYQRCVEGAGGNTFRMIDCITAETAIWDALLNSNYKKLMATLSPTQQKALILAETSWVKFRDSNCGFVNDPDGGQLARMTADSCVLRMTAERALELATFMRPN